MTKPYHERADSYKRPYFCTKEGCGWRGGTMTEAEHHYDTLGEYGHTVYLSTTGSEHPDAQVLPADDDEPETHDHAISGDTSDDGKPDWVDEYKERHSDSD